VSHFSDSKYLLSAADPVLCVKCHSADTQKLLSVHRESVTKIHRCLGCHEPHVTEKPGLLRKVKHAPFARGDCKACHE
jgi:hypothetical protein